MPKVFIKNGFEFVIYTNDHQPPHIHVFYNEYEVVLVLGKSPQDITVKPKSMKNRDVKKAIKYLSENWQEAMNVWEEYHG